MKQYKEKLEEAKKLYESANDDQKYVLESLFPELKESEEEKIRKGLINGFNKCLKDSLYPENAQKYWHGIKIEDILAWLEKQKTTDVLDKEEREFADNVDSYRKDMDEFYKKGYNAGREAEKQYWLEKQVEQKSADKVEPKFKIGDWITDGYLHCKISDVLEDRYIVDTKFGKRSAIPFKRENNYHLWSIQDAKEGDVLFHSDSASNGIFIFKEIIDKGFAKEVICYCDYDSEDHFCLGEHHTCCWADAKILHPATKEQRDTLFAKMKEAGYEWNAEKKVLKEIEHKPTIKVEPKFKVGDWIVTPANKVFQITSIEGTSYKFDNESHYWEICYCDEQCHLWTIQDAKGGDILIYNDSIFIFDEIYENDLIYYGIYEHNKFHNDKYYSFLDLNTININNIYPATKEQRDLLFQKMKEAGYEWDSENKKLRKGK